MEKMKFAAVCDLKETDVVNSGWFLVCKGLQHGSSAARSGQAIDRERFQF